jgi:hypothetical protein
VGDFHVSIVDDIGEMVGWEAVTLHDDVVVLCFLLSVIAVYNVSDSGGLRSAFEPDGELLPVGSALIGLLRGDCSTGARILG